MTPKKERRLALVTGGAVRLGAATCRALAAAGYTVVVHARGHAREAALLAGEIGGVPLVADLLDRDAIGALFERILVNNAGIFERGDASELEVGVWDRHLALNLTAPFLCAQEAARRMLATGGGAIVNLLDIAATRPYRGYAHYGASKAGLEALTRGLAVEWAPAVRVNGVAPGAALMPEWYDEATRAERLRRIPQGVEPGAAAVAEAVRFLVDGPPAITGQVLAVDGGRSAAW